jgi:plasmid stabilization system protein ParE
MRDRIVAFYGDLRAPIATKKNEDQWHEVLLALAKLKAAGPRPTS